MSDYSIQVEGLGKRYRIGQQEEQYDTLGAQMWAWLRSPLSNYRRLRGLSHFSDNGQTEDVIWALRDVSFVVEEGEALGVIGRNGAGKSTLLKVLSRITPPTTGRVLLSGRVASLLEVGTGFHPELTGRENVYLNGSILGMTKREIDRKFDEIVAFSGVEKFIDTPVKRYSSGMRVRLAFSVAAHLEPEILLVDEVLAVGDAEFQRKCLGKMGEISNEGRTVLLVSHKMASIEALCDRAIVMEQGRLAFSGHPKEAVNYYLSQHNVVTEGNVDLRHHSHRQTPPENAVFERIRVLSEDGEETTIFDIGSPIIFEITLDLGGRVLHSPILALGIMRRGVQVCVLSTMHMIRAGFTLTGRMRIMCRWEPGFLAPGTYHVDRLGIKAGANTERLDHIEDVLSFEIADRDVHGTGKITTPGTLLVAKGGWQFCRD